MKNTRISALTITLFTSIILMSGANATDISAPAKVKGNSSFGFGVDLDNTGVGSGSEWYLWTTNAGLSFEIRDDYDDTNHNNTTVFKITHSLYNANSFIVDSSGDINLANGSVFIDKSSNNVGIGTVTPQKDLHIVDTTTTTSGTIITQTRGDASIQLGAYDNTDWSLGAHYSKSNIVLSLPYKTFKITDLTSNATPFVIEQGTASSTLVLDSNDKVGIGTSSPNAKLDVRGDIKAKFSGASTAGDGLTTLMTLDADNSDAGKVSDVAFVLRNGRTGKQWNFRTTKDGQGFAATINGTGGTEFEVVNDTNDFTKAKLYIGGKLVFANGKIQANVLP